MLLIWKYDRMHMHAFVYALVLVTQLKSDMKHGHEARWMEYMNISHRNMRAQRFVLFAGLFCVYLV